MFRKPIVALIAIVLFTTGELHSACIGNQETTAGTKQERAAAQKQSEPATSPGSKQAGANDTSPAIDVVQYQQTVSRGISFLVNQGQDKSDGSFSKQLGPAVTAMCVTSLLQHGIPIQSDSVKQGLQYLEGFVQKDGGVYAPGSSLRNYETSVAVMCFKQANANGKYDETIQNAIAFLKGIQWDGGEGHSRNSGHFGGQGYGKHKRPDASNTSFFIDALKAAGEDPESEAMQNAITFMSRCQNLQSPQNGMDYTKEIHEDDRGGFIYTAVGEGESKAEPRPNGGLRSYASMTYAGLKSFLYAGVSKDDIRVKAAMDWISRNYDLDTNPGMGKQGLYYYYHVFAKALDASGESAVVDSNKLKHNWRAELVAQLSKVQRKDGSWTNEADRWFEGDPNLVTSYSLLALTYCHPDKDKSPSAVQGD